MGTTDYQSVEYWLRKRRAQQDSVKGKETPFRVEFRFRRGTKHYQYFTCLQDAEKAEDRACSYHPFGHAIIEQPTSLQIQIEGPRGGWKKYEGENQ